MQLRRLAALERQKIIDELAKIEIEIADLQGHPGQAGAAAEDHLRRARPRSSTKWGDERRTKIIPFDGEVSMEDLIAREDVVVTITRTGYAKRTKADLYRSQRRGGKGVSAARRCGRTTSSATSSSAPRTTGSCSSRTRAGSTGPRRTSCPRRAGSRKGQHVANLLAFQPDEQIAQVIEIPNYQVAPYLVLATKNGLVKKTRLEEFDSNRTRRHHRDQPARRRRAGRRRARSAPDDDLLLVSKQAQAIRFNATDEALRPMGRATSGVIGMRFTDGDELLAMEVVRDGHGRAGRHRRRIREADSDRGVSGAGARRQGRAHR